MRLGVKEYWNKECTVMRQKNKASKRNVNCWFKFNDCENTVC